MLKRNNPRQLVEGKAVYGPISSLDACYYCDKLLKAGSKAVTVTIRNEDLMAFAGGKGKIHICWPCYIADRGLWTRYPPLKNPAILPEVKEIVKRAPAAPCDLCENKVMPGESCIRIKIINHSVYGYADTIYEHIKCWADPRRGDWYKFPPIHTPHGDNRKMQKEKWNSTQSMDAALYTHEQRKQNPRISKRAKEINQAIIDTVSQTF
jgi:hypothetical protein